MHPSHHLRQTLPCCRSNQWPQSFRWLLSIRSRLSHRLIPYLQCCPKSPRTQCFLRYPLLQKIQSYPKRPLLPTIQTRLSRRCFRWHLSCQLLRSRQCHLLLPWHHWRR